MIINNLEPKIMFIHKILFAVILFFYGHLICFSQSRLSDEYQCKITCTEDTLNKCTIADIDNFHICIHTRQKEYFTDNDILKRDFISYKESLLTFDDVLKLKQSNYTVSFNIESIYLITTKKYKFLVVQGFNAFQIGSDQQTFYIVLKIYNQRIEVVSSYIFDSADDADSIQLVKRNSGLKLKHKELKLLK